MSVCVCVCVTGREEGCQWHYLCLLAHINGPLASIDVALRKSAELLTENICGSCAHGNKLKRTDLNT